MLAPPGPHAIQPESVPPPVAKTRHAATTFVRPMFLVGRPSATALEAAAREALASDFSYPDVGASRWAPRSAPRPGLVVDHNRQIVGRGAEGFARAKASLISWTMFANGWTTILPPQSPQIVGTTVAILVSLPMRLFALNFARIIYRIADEEEHGAVVRYGFAYGTLKNHVESGEERFSVEWRKDSDEVSVRSGCILATRTSARCARQAVRANDAGALCPRRKESHDAFFTVSRPGTFR